MITCTSLSCEERFSVCCGAKSSHVAADVYKCSNCPKIFVGGECNARERIESNALKDWEGLFDLMYKHEEGLGSSAWMVAPSNVKIFIQGLVDDYERQEINHCLTCKKLLMVGVCIPCRNRFRDKAIKKPVKIKMFEHSIACAGPAHCSCGSK